ncbi:aminoglycoside N(3)-acetyltransferase [Clostridium yunnanense]|uniref:aminoglycoside N(3)-acetyltransferase n=1 Tax=Clostridium yunnanense TaxID=2800325 RepID=UPI001A9C404D|nr:AAC(3) family N-acetyltransferase [Clostridium yunnanense]
MKIENRKLVLKEDLLKGFEVLGVKKGQNIIVHASLTSLGFVCGGPQIVIEALLEAVGEDGTIMMPTQTWKNLDPNMGVHWEEPEEWYQIIRDNWPAYDKAITPTNTMGAISEMFRSWPNAKRSDHPVRSFAAVGKNAELLIKDHDLSNIFGKGSPIDKLYNLDGYVMLIGVGYDKNTSIHLADVIAEYDSKHNEFNSTAIMVDGQRKWVTYETLSVDGEDFEDIGRDFEKQYEVKIITIGNGTVRFMRQRDLVDYAIKWIEKNRIVRKV